MATPVVLISGWLDGETEQQMRDAGASAFLLKPFKIHELIEAVERHEELPECADA